MVMPAKRSRGPAAVVNTSIVTWSPGDGTPRSLPATRPRRVGPGQRFIKKALYWFVIIPFSHENDESPAIKHCRAILCSFVPVWISVFATGHRVVSTALVCIRIKKSPAHDHSWRGSRFLTFVINGCGRLIWLSHPSQLFRARRFRVRRGQRFRLRW